LRLAILTGLYVAVVCSAQVAANKIVLLPWTGLKAPGGVYLIGISLALVQLGHYSSPSRREGAVNAQGMIAMGFVGSGLLAAYLAIVVHSAAAFPQPAFDRALGSTWRIVLASLAAFIVSETVDNVVGAPLRGRLPDAARVAITAGISAPIDSVVFLLAAFGSLDFLAGQIVGKLVGALVLGLPIVLVARRFLAEQPGNIVSEPA
jgi:queuosine precursor transporter